MAKSLDVGCSKIVPVRVPDSEKKAVQDALLEGETISSVTRELWKAFVAERSKPTKKRS